MYLNLNELAKECYTNSFRHGFHDNDNRAEKLALIHSEVSEALECLRENPNPTTVWIREDGKPEGYGYELIDVLIRVLDEMNAVGVDVDYMLDRKMEFNRGRAYKHGKAF